jgi:hypothetical protein
MAMLVDFEVTRRSSSNDPTAVKVSTPRATWTVRVGQVWQDCDKRVGTRKVQVIEFWWPMTSTKYIWARCQVVEVEPTRGKHSPGRKAGRALAPREVRIRLDRMRPTSTGFKLLEEPPRASHESSLPY